MYCDILSPFFYPIFILNYLPLSNWYSKFFVTCTRSYVSFTDSLHNNASFQMLYLKWIISTAFLPFTLLPVLGILYIV